MLHHLEFKNHYTKTSLLNYDTMQVVVYKYWCGCRQPDNTSNRNSFRINCGQHIPIMVDQKHQRKRKYNLILCVFHSFRNHKRVYYYTTTISRRNFVSHHPTTYIILYKSQQVAEYLRRVTMYSIKYFISYTCKQFARFVGGGALEFTRQTVKILRKSFTRIFQTSLVALPARGIYNNIVFTDDVRNLLFIKKSALARTLKILRYEQTDERIPYIVSVEK